MFTRVGIRRLAALLVLTVGAVYPGAARAQLQDIHARLHGGLILPAASYGDYFRLGPSAGVDLAYPLNERLDLKLDLDWDWVQTTSIYPTPDTNLWRYRLGVDGLLVGDRQSGALVQGYAGLGFTTARSKEFWLRSQETYEYEGLTLNETAVTASGGVRVGLRTPDGLTWWLTGKLNWSPVNETHKAYLQELARNELDELGSALGLAVTVGVTLW